jgi:membrane protein DedA with SNARE-associated domain
VEQALFTFIQNWYVSTGYIGILLAMTLESCCIPLPSEIVMPLAGLFVATGAATATGQLSLVGVTIAGSLGCLLGSALAYQIGATGGVPLLMRYGRYILISQADLNTADRWFTRYGSPVAFFSRLLPVVRTYISLPAGIAKMNFPKFLIYSFLGSVPWTFALAFIGYKFGPQLQAQMAKLSNIFHGLDAIVIVVFLVLVGLYVYRHIKHDRAARAAMQNDQSAAHR